MRNALLSAALVLALISTPVLAQQHQPGLSSDRQKPQQNSADEAAIHGRMDDGIKPPDAGRQQEAGKKIEDAAADAKQKSDAKGSSETPREMNGATVVGRSIPPAGGKISRQVVVQAWNG